MGGFGEVGAEELEGDRWVVSERRKWVDGKGWVRRTPPSQSLTTSTNPTRLPWYAAHFSYNVARLAPSCSRLYTNRHSSTIPSRAGTMMRISSATGAVNSLASCCVSGENPSSCNGSSGGGRIGDMVRCGCRRCGGV